MLRLFLDTNVVLDMVLNRPEFIQEFCASKIKMLDAIITRDKKGFKPSGIQVLTPVEFLRSMQ